MQTSEIQRTDEKGPTQLLMRQRHQNKKTVFAGIQTSTEANGKARTTKLFADSSIIAGQKTKM